MRSPATSRAIDARSSVVVMTFNWPWAPADPDASSAARNIIILVFIENLSTAGLKTRPTPARSRSALQVRHPPDTARHQHEVGRTFRSDERPTTNDQRLERMRPVRPDRKH